MRIRVSISDDVFNRCVCKVMTRSLYVFCTIMWLGFVSLSYAQEIQIIETEELPYLDPIRGRSPAWERFVSLYSRPMQQFIGFNTSGPDNYREQFATIVGLDNNGIRVRIKPNARFYRLERDEYGNVTKIQDSPITPDDIIASFKNWTSPESAVGNKSARDQIRRIVNSVRKLENGDLHFIYKDAPPQQPRAALDFPIVSAEALPAGTATLGADKLGTFNSEPWGAGPFVFQKKKREGTALVYSFSRAWSGSMDHYSSVKVRIVNNPLDVGQILSHPTTDICFPQVLPRNRNSLSGELLTIDYTLPVVHQIVLNTKKPQLHDPKVRRALSMLVNRKSLATMLNNEVNIVGCPFGAGFWWSCPRCSEKDSLAAYDPNEAKRLLESAGWIKSENTFKKNGEVLSVSITGTIGTQDNWVQQVTTQISEAWREAGIESESRQLSPAKYERALDTKDFDAIFFVAKYGRYPEVAKFFLENGTDNYSQINDLSIRQQWEDLKSESSSEALLAKWQDLDCTIGELTPSIFLWSPRTYAAYSNWISVGTNFTPHNIIGMIELWTKR